MKNVLFLLHLPPPVHGSSMMGQIIKDSTLINSSFSCQYLNLLASDKVSESGKLSLKKLFALPKTVFKLLVKLISNRPVLCYFALTTTGIAFYRDVLLVSLLKLFKVKRLYHLHNKGVSGVSHSAVKRFLYSFVFKGADVILLSKHLYSDIQRYVQENKIHICANGIPETRIKEKKHVANGEVVKILFLSNLIESKGVYILLKTMFTLKRKNIPFEGIFVGGEGDISASSFQEQVEKLGLQTHVKYLGKKYGANKDAIFQQADVFVFPTYYSNECFPLVLLEAMQYFLPIISTPEGGIQDILENGKNGFLIPQKEVDDLSERLEQLILNPELRHKMGIAGRQKYLKHYTLDVFEKTLNKILLDA